MKANEKKAIVSSLLATATTVAYESGTRYGDVVAMLDTCHRLGSTDDYNKLCDAILQGRMVSYIERPPVSVLKDRAFGKIAKDYASTRWDNLDATQRFAAAADIIALPPSTSDKPDRRSKFEDKAVGAARSFLSTARGHAGIVSNRTGTGGRKPRQGKNEPDKTPPALVARKLSNDNEAAEYFATAVAQLLAACDMNNQPGSPKSVKGIVHKVSTIVAQYKTAIDAALKS